MNNVYTLLWAAARPALAPKCKRYSLTGPERRMSASDARRRALQLPALLDHPNCPEIVGQLLIRQVGVGQREVALHPPLCAP